MPHVSTEGSSTSCVTHNPASLAFLRHRLQRAHARLPAQSKLGCGERSGRPDRAGDCADPEWLRRTGRAGPGVGRGEDDVEGSLQGSEPQQARGNGRPLGRAGAPLPRRGPDPVQDTRTHAPPPASLTCEEAAAAAVGLPKESTEERYWDSAEGDELHREVES